ncbi:MAG: NTP transferase domain-containing protein [Thermoplasmata archaeon]
MLGVVMAGGKSSRFGKEKMLIKFRNDHLIDIACKAIIESGNKCVVAISNNAPETKKYVMQRYDYIETPGDGYCFDVSYILKNYEKTFLTVSSDLPFLKSSHIFEFLNAYKGGSMSGMLKKKNYLIYVGINIVSDKNLYSIYIFTDYLLGININTQEDLKYAESLQNLAGLQIP